MEVLNTKTHIMKSKLFELEGVQLTSDNKHYFIDVEVLAVEVKGGFSHAFGYQEETYLEVEATDVKGVWDEEGNEIHETHLIEAARTYAKNFDYDLEEFYID